MPYLNLDPNYHDHPKTIRLMAALGDLADAIPIRLWTYCARIHPKDGALKGYSDTEIEAVLRWRGAEKKCVAALVSVGFLEPIENGFRCVDWRQHQGHLEAFSIRGKVAAKARWSKYKSGNASSMPEVMQKPCKSNAPSVPSVPTNPNHVGRSAPFTLPSLEEVAAYCLERGGKVDPHRWHDFYAAKGWMVGRNKMKDWRAAVRTWEKNATAAPAPVDDAYEQAKAEARKDAEEYAG